MRHVRHAGWPPRFFGLVGHVRVYVERREGMSSAQVRRAYGRSDDAGPDSGYPSHRIRLDGQLGKSLGCRDRP